MILIEVGVDFSKIVIIEANVSLLTSNANLDTSCLETEFFGKLQIHNLHDLGLFAIWF